MSITAKQIQMLQIERRKYEAAAKAQGVEFGEAEWRTVLRSIGGVRPDDRGYVSSKQLTQVGFDHVIAFLRKAPVDDCSRLRHEIGQRYTALAAGRYGTIQLGGIVFKVVGKSVRDLKELDRWQCQKVIEAIKAIANRTADDAEKGKVSHGCDDAGECRQ